LFKIFDRIDTPEGPGTIKELRKSTYSKEILFYTVKLDKNNEDYYCPIASATKL
jgi:hypothetical protein